MSQGPYDPRFNQQNPFQPQGFPNQGFPGQQLPGQNYGQFQLPPSGGGGMKTLLIVLGAMAGGAALLFLLCCGGMYAAMQPPKASPTAQQPFNVSAVPVPAFPERGTPNELVPGVQVYTVPINGQSGGHYSPPGHGGNLYVYLPTGEHKPKSLPCVFITGAGTNMMEGYEFDEIDLEGDAAEHVPYVRAGMAVIAYELDGSGFNEDSDENQMYQDFKAACAGVVNARNAIDFALQRVPEVNPNHLYTAGHSSAGTCALLVAAHEPRIKGVMAYAPCTDVEHFQPGFLIRAMASEMPGLVDFLCQSSPKTHETRINCPVFIFHAEGDDTVKVKESRTFVDQLKKHNADVTLQTVPGGDHYESMISQGLPAGLNWLKQKTGK